MNKSWYLFIVHNKFLRVNNNNMIWVFVLIKYFISKVIKVRVKEKEVNKEEKPE